MKRFKILALVGAILLMSLNASASVVDLSKTYTAENDTGQYLTTYVPTTTFIPGVHKVISMTVMPTDTQTDAGHLGKLYDASEASELINDNLLGAMETLANESRDRFFPYPKTVSDQLAIYQSEYTTVIIDYTR